MSKTQRFCYLFDLTNLFKTERWSSALLGKFCSIMGDILFMPEPRDLRDEFAESSLFMAILL